MELEGTPTLMPVPGVDLDLYRKTLIARFCQPGSQGHAGLPVRREFGSHPKVAGAGDSAPTWRAAARSSAARRSLPAGRVTPKARDEQGEPIVVVDRMKDELMAIAQHNRENITAFIENREVFGDLCDNARFVTAYTEALQSLYHVGAKETVRRYA